MNSYYYLDQNNEARGPLSWQELEGLLRAGSLALETLVTTSGADQWLPFRLCRPATDDAARPPQDQAQMQPVNSSPTQASPQRPAQTQAPAVAALHKAWEVFKGLTADPVGKLPQAAAELGNAGAQKVGVVFGSALLTSIVGTAYFVCREMLKANLFGVVVAAATPFVCLTATISLTRLVFRGKGTLGTDGLIAGTALLPFAFLLPVAAALGLDHIMATYLISFFAGTTFLLLVNAGCTQINHLSPAKTTLAVPLIILGTAFLAAFILSSLKIHLPMDPFASLGSSPF